MGDFAAKIIASLLDFVVNNTALNSAINAITTNDYGLFDEGNIVNQVTNAISVVGFSICALFFLMSLVDLSMSDRFSIETFMKHFINLAIGCFGVINADYFITFGWGLSKWVSDLLVKVSGDTPVQWGEIRNCSICAANVPGWQNGVSVCTSPLHAAIESLDFSGVKWLFLGLVCIIIGLIGVLASAIATVAIYIAGFSRLLEIGIRGCFMPIGLAFMTDDGWKGAGGRYLKKFIALCCQGPAYLLVGKLHSSLISNSLKSVLSSAAGNPIAGDLAAIGGLVSTIGILLAGTFAAVALIFKVGSIVNDVFGV